MVGVILSLKIMDIILWGGILFVSLFILVKSADYFTLGSEKIGLFLGLSPFIVGATIVSIGGSMPELATSILAALGGEKNFAIDNVIGSNIANTLLIGGLVSIFVGTLKVKEELIDVDLPFFFMSSALFLLFIMDGQFTWQEGVLTLIMLTVFIFYTLSSDIKSIQNTQKVESFQASWILYIIGGSVGIFFGAKYTIEAVSQLGEILGIASSIITMLVVAVGTSLPELVISIRASLKGKHSIALGNIFGSNTFNSLAVVGVPSLFTTLTTSQTALTFGVPLFIVSTLAFIFTTSDNKIQRWEGMALLILYGVFVGNIIGFL
ncbi:conjugal transfer protein TraR [Candidatus Gracilibacteria bacterium]|nr:MAG: conjugal transfer protein TraR [Candidatus Gracilibacteria bacterium]